MSDYSIESENNCLNPLESNIGKAIGFNVYSPTNKMEDIYAITVNGLDSISDPGHNYKATNVTPVDVSIKTEEGLTTFTINEELTEPFTFEFNDVYLDPNFVAQETNPTLTISILGKDDVLLETLYGEVFISQITPTIESFQLSPSYIYNNGKVKISWKCTNIDSYSIHFENEKGQLVELDNKPSIDNNGGCEGEAEIIINTNSYKPIIDVFLKATLGNNVAQERNNKKIFNASKNQWSTTSLVEEVASVGQTSAILDIIGNEHDEKIWALARYHQEKIHLWNSNTGSPDDWNPLKENSSQNNIFIKEEDLHRPSLFFATSPNEASKLYFIGGSSIEVEKASNKVSFYNVDLSINSDSRRGELEEIAWEPRMGQACVVFPYEGENDNIWMIGGADEFGNGLNEVWRWDGVNWHDETDGLPDNFPERCQFSATTVKRTLHDGSISKEIWIGGGYDAYQGNPVREMWRYFKKGNTWSWQQVSDIDSGVFVPLNICKTSEWLTAAALTSQEGRILRTCVSSSNDNPSQWINSNRTKEDTAGETRECFLFGTNDDLSGAGGWASPPSGRGSSNTYFLRTVGFNGCVWLMAQRYYKKDDIALSDLYYLVPEQAKK